MIEMEGGYVIEVEGGYVIEVEVCDRGGGWVCDREGGVEICDRGIQCTVCDKGEDVLILMGVITTELIGCILYFLLNRKRESAGWKQSGLDQL